MKYFILQFDWFDLSYKERGKKKKIEFPGKMEPQTFGVPWCSCGMEGGIRGSGVRFLVSTRDFSFVIRSLRDK